MFFFFQAEDGIRDVAVTGVQTCALPISSTLSRCMISRPWGSCSPTRRSRRSSTTRTTTSARSEEHTSELQSRLHLVCRLLLEKKKRRNVQARADQPLAASD